ncbi:hypothetical protein CRX72_21445 [Pantoea sp. BRM17]|nr:hypothetical protein CRX72_21445 [Pantoea sp. BRM17]
MAQRFLQQKKFVLLQGTELDALHSARLALLFCLPVLKLGVEWLDGFHDVLIYPEPFAVETDTVPANRLNNGFDVWHILSRRHSFSPSTGAAMFKWSRNAHKSDAVAELPWTQALRQPVFSLLNHERIAKRGKNSMARPAGRLTPGSGSLNLSAFCAKADRSERAPCASSAHRKRRLRPTPLIFAFHFASAIRSSLAGRRPFTCRAGQAASI